MHCSSGTTGTPVAVCYTQSDINSWADLMARCLYMAGVRKTTCFRTCPAAVCSRAASASISECRAPRLHDHSGGRGQLQAPAQAGEGFRDHSGHILPSCPASRHDLIEEGEDPKALSLRIACVGAEPYTEETRRRIEALFDMKVYNSCGLSEMNGPA